MGATPVAAQPAALDCNAVTGAQIAAALGRAVQPVATTTGCAWGTRIDDPSTVLVRIETYAVGEAYDARFQTSREQQRVVYGTDTDAGSGPATALWVAGGEPMGVGSDATTALGDTHVVVSRQLLGASDKQARLMALAIAQAVNVA